MGASLLETLSDCPLPRLYQSFCPHAGRLQPLSHPVPISTGGVSAPAIRRGLSRRQEDRGPSLGQPPARRPLRPFCGAPHQFLLQRVGIGPQRPGLPPPTSRTLPVGKGQGWPSRSMASQGTVDSFPDIPGGPLTSPSLEQEGGRRGQDGRKWEGRGRLLPPLGVRGISPSPSITVITITMSLIKRQGEARQRGAPARL